MDTDARAGGGPLAMDGQDDLAELEFVPVTDEEAINVEDRTYLFGVHVDAVRGG